MRNLAKKGGLIWAFFAILPMAFIANMIGKIIDLDSYTIFLIQIPALLIQIFCVYMALKYKREIFF